VDDGLAWFLLSTKMPGTEKTSNLRTLG